MKTIKDDHLEWFSKNSARVPPDKYLVLDLENDELFCFDTEDEIGAFINSISKEYASTLFCTHSAAHKTNLNLKSHEMMDWSDEEAW